MAKGSGQRRRWTDLPDRFGSASPEGGAIEALPHHAEELAARHSALSSGGERYALQPHALMPGNELVPLIGGAEAYPAMLAAIDAAEHAIDLETYIWEDDATGRKFAAHLLARAQAGVRVRILVDSAGGWATGSLFNELLKSKAHIAFFHPFLPWARRWGWTVRDHRKLLIVDARVGFTGGFNIGDEYAPPEWGGHGWRDVHARVVGPVVGPLQRLFDDAFRYASGEHSRGWAVLGETTRPIRQSTRGALSGKDASSALARDSSRAVGNALGPEFKDLAQAVRAEEAFAATVAPVAPVAPPASSDGTAHTALLQALAVGRRRDRRFIQRHLQFAISMARTRISLYSAYFIPNSSWRKALRRAARRGVEVRVIVPRTNDLHAVHYASRYTYQSLLDAGVRIYEYLPTMMHAKVFAVDGLWCAIGSYNLDQRSLMYNWEVAVAGIDAAACGRLELQFDHDLAQSREIDPLLWPKRNWREKARERFFYFFRLLL